MLDGVWNPDINKLIPGVWLSLLFKEWFVPSHIHAYRLAKELLVHLFVSGEISFGIVVNIMG